LHYILEERHGCHAKVSGREVTIFSSNDYLGLSAHPEVIEAAAEAARTFGIGTGGAPGTTGTTAVHEKLRAAVARFKGRDRAMLFPSGYQANQAIHHALDSEKTVFYIDRRHHPSALDGVRLAGKSRLVRFDHFDLRDLERALGEYRDRIRVVSLPSVFTVDGDIAPLDKLIALKKAIGFILILDEAHASGCVGKTGRGIEEQFDLKGAADFLMGTFSKALGSQGGFLAFDISSEKHLTAIFRPLEYSTSLSAVSAAAALKAVELLESDPGLMEALRSAKATIIDECNKLGIEIIHGDSMVMLIPCRDSDGLQTRLFEDGFLIIPVQANFAGKIRSCLRITPMAMHTAIDIHRFVKALAQYKELLG
jgi:7-keto-8-aminopelargonate synthetase-like enzyme